MVAKRALVVDDSRSARAFLAKLLEEQQIEVDAAETAEQAIDYLLQNRPDVIFMDHLMPGMDGFQAVQAIKANPRTADIPILMYTSQEGELYLGQARALGAVGVVQKTMAPGDVRALLQRLELVPGPVPVITSAPVLPAAQLQTSMEEDAEVTTEVPTAPAGPTSQELLKAEVAALRRELADGLKACGEQMSREVRSLRALSAPAATLPQMVPEKPRHSLGPWLLTVAACVGAAVLGTLLWKEEQLLTSARTELADSKSTVALLTARLAPAPADAMAVTVPFGEIALDGARIDALRDFVARIATLGRSGTVEVRHYAGRFCLAGSAAAGYVLADESLPAARCVLVAEANDAVLGKTNVASPAFTSALEELRSEHAALTIEVSAGQGEAAGRQYPEASSTHAPTAAEWNAVAAVNNRVEIRWYSVP
ncbi:MAG: response regulator [Pseudomonadota bacterium]